VLRSIGCSATTRAGKDTKRPQLTVALEYPCEGVTLVVHSLDRLARNVEGLRRIVRELNDRGYRSSSSRIGLDSRALYSPFMRPQGLSTRLWPSSARIRWPPNQVTCGPRCSLK